MRAVFIFAVFVVGLSIIGNVLKGVGAPWNGIVLFGAVVLLLFMLNRFWNVRPGAQEKR